MVAVVSTADQATVATPLRLTVSRSESRHAPTPPLDSSSTSNRAAHSTIHSAHLPRSSTKNPAAPSTDQFAALQARFRRHKAAVKLHTLLDLRGAIPTLIYLSDGRLHDVNFLDQLPIEPGAYYVMDRGYVDFNRLHRFVIENAFFVTRAKRRLRSRVVESRPVELGGGVRADQVIKLTGSTSRKTYPERLRKVRYYDAERLKMLAFLTNDFSLPASVIAQLYRCRWQIELFFKWIKQNLKIKTFYGYSNNAVRTQVWIAVCTYVLVVIARKELKLEASLSQILQIVSVSVFDKVPLPQLLTDAQNGDVPPHEPSIDSNQLMFNGL